MGCCPSEPEQKPNVGIHLDEVLTCSDSYKITVIRGQFDTSAEAMDAVRRAISPDRLHLLDSALDDEHFGLFEMLPLGIVNPTQTMEFPARGGEFMLRYLPDGRTIPARANNAI
jgi:hypothetical protein